MAGPWASATITNLCAPELGEGMLGRPDHQMAGQAAASVVRWVSTLWYRAVPGAVGKYRRRPQPVINEGPEESGPSAPS